MKTNICITFTIYFLLTLAKPALAQQPNWARMEERADSLEKAENYTAAVKLYEKLLTNEPKRSYLLSMAGICYFRTGNYDKAKQKFLLAAMYRNPNKRDDLATDYANLSAAYAHSNNTAKEVEYSLKAYQINENALTLWNAVSAYIDNNQPEEALIVLEKSKLQKSPSFNGLYGLVYYRMKKYDKSVKYFDTFFDTFNKETDDMPSVTFGDFYDWAWSAAAGQLLSQDFDKQPLLDADTARLSRLFNGLRANDMIGPKTFAHLTTLSINTKKYQPVFDTYIEALPMPQYSLEKLKALLENERFSKAEKLANQLILADSFSVQDMHDIQLWKFEALYRPYLQAWKAGEIEANNPQLDKVVKAFADCVNYKKDDDYGSDTYLHSLISTSFENIMYYGKKDKEGIKTILTAFMQTIPNEKLRNEFLDAIKQFKQ